MEKLVYESSKTSAIAGAMHLLGKFDKAVSIEKDKDGYRGLIFIELDDFYSKLYKRGTQLIFEASEEWLAEWLGVCTHTEAIEIRSRNYNSIDGIRNVGVAEISQTQAIENEIECMHHIYEDKFMDQVFADIAANKTEGLKIKVVKEISKYCDCEHPVFRVDENGIEYCGICENDLD